MAGMTDKQLRSLSRTQLLEILYQQEKEIERLTGELSKPRPNQATVLINAMIQAAEDTTTKYLTEIQAEEEKKIARINRLEADARRRYEEVRVWSIEAAKIINETLQGLQRENMAGGREITALRDDYEGKMEAMGLKIPSRKDTPGGAYNVGGANGVYGASGAIDTGGSNSAGSANGANGAYGARGTYYGNDYDDVTGVIGGNDEVIGASREVHSVGGEVNDASDEGGSGLGGDNDAETTGVTPR